MSGTTPSPLGVLGKLPLELRRMIYTNDPSGLSMLFRQIYTIHPDTGEISMQPGQRSHSPNVLRLSMTIREEAADEFMVRRVAIVTVHKGSIGTAGFPSTNLKDVTDYGPRQFSSVQDRIVFPNCSHLTIGIRIPSTAHRDTRRFRDLFAIRRNVATIVRVLNNQRGQQRPDLSLSFLMANGNSAADYNYNDFAILAGPVIGLRRDKYGSSELHPHEPELLQESKTERQLSFIQASELSPPTTYGPLVYQQAILDIKLPLLSHRANITSHDFLQLLRKRSGSTMLAAIHRLKEWHMAAGLVEPGWIGHLQLVMEGQVGVKKRNRANFWERIMGVRLPPMQGSHVFLEWAAGRRE
jgi:hypothetical protein